MVNPINISLSGLAAAAKRVEVSASNIANQASTRTNVDGRIENRPYVPKTVDQVSLSTGGTQALVRDVNRPSDRFYNPEDPAADAEGFVQLPNVDTATELVNIKIASYDYKANLKAIKVQDDLQKNLLDIIS